MRFVVACASALFALPAHAGRRDFGGVESAEVVGDGNVELESRIADDNDVGALHLRSTAWWIAPTIGLGDEVELQLPVEMMWRSETGSESDFSLSRFAADIRYRLAPALIRFEVARDVRIRNLGHAELDVATAHDVGAIRLAADAGVTFEANRGGAHFDVRLAGGISARVKPAVRLGLEAFGMRSFDSSIASWAVVGPNLAWTHGRFWFASSLGIGVHNISSAARLTWGTRF